MSKRIFVLLVVFMTVSLLGIIIVQVYWTREAIRNKRLQFQDNVRIALARTSERIKEREELEALRQYNKFIENDQFRTSAEIKNFLFQQIDQSGKEKFTFGTTILEENFKIPSGFLNNDSIIIKRVSGKEDIYFSKIVKTKESFRKALDENKYTIFKKYSSINQDLLSEIIRQKKKYTPIHKRVSNRVLNKILEEELSKRNINQSFKYGVYEKGLATPLKSGYYTISPEDSYFYPLLENEEGNSKYKLYITFPNEGKNLFSGLIKILLLSLLFIIIIIIGFTTSLYQLVKQKKISEIKTDFINNMTHEFKTPIATINLALDAIKNPKIIKEEDKVIRYIQMIREENKRMHGQVENVLRISRLEKNQLDISKETVNMHDIIEEAVEHVELLVSDKNGQVTIHFEAVSNKVLGNQFHLTNLIVNVLENAIKYSEKAPKIDVFTESTNKFFVFKIKDEGIGMSKSAQKQVFDKFYREHKGNVHNVKGHGLGLAYVKEIVNNHQGQVYVDSEKGKGSTFTVKLPLI